MSTDNDLLRPNTRCEFWRECQAHHGFTGSRKPCSFEVIDSLEDCPHWWRGEFVVKADMPKEPLHRCLTCGSPATWESLGFTYCEVHRPVGEFDPEAHEQDVIDYFLEGSEDAKEDSA